MQSGHVCGDNIDLIDGKPTGSIRISFGYLSSIEDSNRFLKFLEECFIEMPINNDNNLRETDVEVEKASIPKLHRILLYPVKSCKAFEVKSWPMGPRGLLYDRKWMIVNESGLCLSLKQEPNLYNIRPRICLENKVLILECEDMNSLTLPLDYDISDNPVVSTSICQSRVCGDKVNAIDCGDEASLWLTKVLGRSVRLIMQRDDSKRSSRIKSSNDQQHSLSLANTGQILLISSTSASVLHNFLQAKTKQQSTITSISTVDSLCDRFRANLIIQGSQPFDEDTWKSIMIRQCLLTITNPCTRCHIICIDPNNKMVNKDPLKALMELRGKKVRCFKYEI